MIGIFHCNMKWNRIHLNPSLDIEHRGVNICRKEAKRPRGAPSTIPQAVFLPRTRFPLTWYSLSLPTTAKGIASYVQKHVTMHLLWTALHCFKTCIKYLPVSRGKLDCDAKKKWWNNPVYLLWSCRCRSCPPCPRQTPSEGKTQSRPFPVPFLPKAQKQPRNLAEAPSSQEELAAAELFNNDFQNAAFNWWTLLAWSGCWNSLAAWTPVSPQWSLCQLSQWWARCLPSGSGASWTPRLTGEDLGRKKKSQRS